MLLSLEISPGLEEQFQQCLVFKRCFFCSSGNFDICAVFVLTYFFCANATPSQVLLFLFFENFFFIFSTSAVITADYLKNFEGLTKPGPTKPNMFDTIRLK